MENSRTCEICNVDVHKGSYMKHSGSKNHLEIEMIIPEWLFKEQQTTIKKQI